MPNAKTFVSVVIVTDGPAIQIFTIKFEKFG